MIDVMYSRYILTISAIVVVLMMNVLYFTKKKNSEKLRHKMYSNFIVINTLVLIFELIIMAVFWMDLPFSVCAIAFRVRDVCLMTYFVCLFFYYYTSVLDEKYKDVASFVHGEKIIKAQLIFTAIVMIVHVFLPYNVVDKHTFNAALGGPAFYLAIGYCVITTLETIFIIISKSKNGLKGSVKLSLIWLFALMLVILIFQVVFYDVSVMGIVSSIYILGLYFLFENPDLELVEEIDALTAETDKANRTKFDFLSGISQEMMTPMGEITSITSNLLNSKEEISDEKIRESIKQIEVSSKNFLEIINNALDVSNTERDNDTLFEKEYSLGEVLNGLTESAKEKLIGKNVQLKVNIDNSIPNHLYGDSSKIEQIVSNIISNAIKFTEVGKVAITLTKEIKNAKIVLRFKVSDSGIGIKEEDYSKIFTEYTRLEDAVDKGIEGSGLGLSIAKKNTDLLDGKIWFESEYGAGTSFYVEIPQQVVAMTPTIGEYEEKEEAKEEAKKEKIDCSKYRILIVEDDHLNLEVTKRLCARYGFEIDCCYSGKDCIYKYKKGEKYDMMLIDHKMPEMSGIEVMQIIRKLKDYQAPPLVALTANAYAGSRDMYIKEGFDDFLAKPIDMDELDDLINKYFNK